MKKHSDLKRNLTSETIVERGAVGLPRPAEMMTAIRSIIVALVLGPLTSACSAPPDTATVGSDLLVDNKAPLWTETGGHIPVSSRHPDGTETAAAIHTRSAPGSEDCAALGPAVYVDILADLARARGLATASAAANPGSEADAAVAMLDQATAKITSISDWQQSTGYTGSNASVAYTIHMNWREAIGSLRAAARAAATAAATTASADASYAQELIVRAIFALNELATQGGRCYLDAIPARGEAPAPVAAFPTSCVSLDATALDPLALLIDRALAAAGDGATIDGGTTAQYPQLEIDAATRAAQEIATLRTALDTGDAAEPATAMAMQIALDRIDEDLTAASHWALVASAAFQGAQASSAFETEVAASDDALHLFAEAGRCWAKSGVPDGIADPPADRLLLTCSDTPCTSASRVVVTFHDLPGDADDRIGIYPAYGSSAAPIQASPTAGALAGALTFSALPTGQPLVARVLPAGSSTPLGPPSAPLTLPAATSAASVIAACPGSCDATQPIPVFFQGMPGYPGDWIGIIPVGEPDDKYVAWKSTGGQRDGSVMLGPVPPGAYLVKGFRNHSRRVVASSDIVIVDLTSLATTASDEDVVDIGGADPAAPSTASDTNPDEVLCGGLARGCCPPYLVQTGPDGSGPHHCQVGLGCSPDLDICLACGQPGGICCDGPETEASGGGMYCTLEEGCFEKKPMCEAGSFCTVDHTCTNSCGSSGQACCAPNDVTTSTWTCLGDNLTCNKNKWCVHCGQFGDLPCFHDTCEPGLIPDETTGRCTFCGGEEQRSCDGECEAGLTWNAGRDVCVPCGAPGQLSCDGACTGGAVEVGRRCLMPDATKLRPLILLCALERGQTEWWVPPGEMLGPVGRYGNDGVYTTATVPPADYGRGPISHLRLPATQLYSSAYSGTDNVFDYISEISYGRLDTSAAKVIGPYVIPVGILDGKANPPGNDNRGAYVRACLQTAKQVDPSVSEVGFSDLVGVFNVPIDAGNGGEVRSNPIGLHTNFAAHEMLHSHLGGLHTQQLGCVVGSKQVDYCDPWDEMSAEANWSHPSARFDGFAAANSIVAANRLKLGVLRDSEIYLAVQPGIRHVTLQAVNRPELTGYRVIKIPVALEVFLTVELMRKSGWDVGDRASGVLIHEVRGRSSDPLNGLISLIPRPEAAITWTSPLDNAETQGTARNLAAQQDASWKAGATYYRDGYAITIDSIDETASTARITILIPQN